MYNVCTCEKVHFITMETHTHTHTHIHVYTLTHTPCCYGDAHHSYHSPAGSNLSPRQLSSIDERRSAIPQQTSSSFLDPTSSPGSLSIDATPIPSPQPSFTSSQRSARSSGRGSSRKRRRNHSPGHMSSGSEDTIKVQCTLYVEFI